MHNFHSRNTVRYYVLIIVFLAFLFFSNDFGLIDVQKTAIVTAVGIDREPENFIVTSQISIPQAGAQGKSSQSVQLVSRGETIAEAFEQINTKTGWYPKLVFCNLIVFGEKAAQENVFDALDFFLRDEYLSDDCQLAVCKGFAKDLLNTTALVDPNSSQAINKVLSSHAERVGSVHPTTLREFSIGYFGESKSGVLPILKTEPQQESVSNSTQPDNKQSTSSSSSEEMSDSAFTQEEGQGSGESKSGEQQNQNKPVFSARTTALFVHGKWQETLSAEETFALNAAIGKLRLASYSVETKNGICTLIIKQNAPKIKLDVGENGRGVVKVNLVMTAGIADYSKAQPLDQLADAGNVPDGVFSAAQKKLEAELSSVYEKAKNIGCDVFNLREQLMKFKKRRYHLYKDTLLDDTVISVKVQFQNLR